MADLTITPANVAQISGTTLVTGVAGETILAGQPLYLKAADARLWKARSAAAATTEESTPLGIAMHGATAGQPVTYASGGVINIGATTVKTTPYVLSATAGGIAPMTDLVSTNKIVYLGYATDVTGTFTIFKAVTGAAI